MCLMTNRRPTNRPVRSGGSSSLLEREAEVSALFFSLSPGKFPKSTRTPRLCFTPFCFNALCQLKKLLNLRALIFCLTPFRWFLMSVNLFNGNVIFYLRLFKVTPTFSGTQVGRRTRPGCTSNRTTTVCNHFISNSLFTNNCM
jgi:hypothetical protein